MGYIYILTNPSFPDYVKIGYADNVEKRLQQLNRSECIPFAFRVYATYEVDSRLFDVKIHAIIDKLNPNLRSIENFDGRERVREFYAMPAEDAYSILEALAEIHGRSDKLKLAGVSADVDSAPEQTEDVQESADDGKTVRRRAPFRFSLACVPIGAEIEYYHPGNEHSGTLCRVVDDKMIEYDGAQYALSALAGIFERYPSVQGPKFFRYQGEILDDRRKRMELENG